MQMTSGLNVAPVSSPVALAFLDNPGAALRAAVTSEPAWLSLQPPARLLGPLTDGCPQGVWLDGTDLCWSLDGRTGRREGVLDEAAPEAVKRAAVVAAARVLFPQARMME